MPIVDPWPNGIPMDLPYGDRIVDRYTWRPSTATKFIIIPADDDDRRQEKGDD